MEDLFGEKRILLPENRLLEMVCNMVLEYVGRHPESLDGDKTGEIDAKLRVGIWLEQGLAAFIRPECLEDFKTWASDPKRCIDPEAISRARRLLVEKDFIRLSASAIKWSEQQKKRVEAGLR